MMQRFRITVEYDGTPYVGWQAQTNGVSVQEVLERAIHAFSKEKVRVFGAGRTDAGVHALGQVAHFDLERKITPLRLMNAINAHLTREAVVVLDAKKAAADFDARRSAARRHYRYRILNRRPPPVLEKNRVWHVRRLLDAKAMHEAAQVLVGKHDFTTFRAIRCQAKSPVKTLERLDVRRGGEEIVITAEARSFLHHQVRSMVGTLKLVGEGRWTTADVRAALEAKDRTRVGLNAPARGLYLVKVDYR